MKKLFICLTLVTIVVPSIAIAERQLSKDEIVEIFTDVTFEGVFLPKDLKFKAYDAPDGTLLVELSNGKKLTGRTWYVNDKNQRCTTNPKKKKDRCTEVFDVGNGTYHQYLSGKHIHTLTNFLKGNHF